MADTVADFMVRRLREWGVERIYGYPGDGINGFMGALGRAGDDPAFVLTRHEELAAFMACAQGKYTGRPGVCLATSGPGAIHLLNGLYDAKMDHAPVVAIVGQQRSMSIGGDYQQEVDLVSLFKDVAHPYVHVCAVPEQARTLVDRAMRIAWAERVVTCIIVPNDVQEMKHHDPPREHGAVFTGVGWSAPRVIPRDDDLKRAADVLNAGDRVAILVGAGALHASDEVAQVADVLGAGVAKALLGKAVLPDDLSYVTGSIGLLGTRPSYEMMRRCDTLLMIGSSFPYSEWLPKPEKARGVQIDISPRRLSLRFPMEVALCGDSRETLQALLPLLARKSHDGWRRAIEAEVADWWDVLERRAYMPANPINPQRVFWELSPRLPAEAVLLADSGSAANWWARDLKIRQGMTATLSGNLATMGPGMPYGLAAKYVHPDRPVVACVGDGAMLMNGNNALVSVANSWRRWEDPRFVVLVLNNRDLNQVTWEQRVMAGIPRFDPSQLLPSFSFARYAELLGLRAIELREPEDIVSGIDDALSSDCPVVIDAWVDPEVPPLPPHITVEEARRYLMSMLKGDPATARNLEQSIQQLLATFLPRPLVGAP